MESRRTKRAVDWRDSTQLTGIILTSGFSCSQALPQLARQPLTHTVVRLKQGNKTLTVGEEMNKRTYQLGLVKIPVSDIAISAQFYEKDLGFEQEFIAPEYGWAQFKTGEISLALYKPGMGGGERQLGGSVDFHLVLDGEEFDELSKTMLETKRLSEDMVHKGADGSTFIEILDPDENVLKVFRRR